MNSFISWVGGKRLLRNEIVSRFPEHFDRYVEVFGGAAWVLFHKEKHAKQEIYNDINSELVNLFRCVKYHPEALWKETNHFAFSSREVFLRMRNCDTRNLTEIQRAARYLYLIKMSFGTTMDSFGCMVKTLPNEELLQKVRERLSRVLIENKSFDKIIPALDDEGTLFYCDPPYHSTEKFYDTGEFVFDESKHELLRDMLKGIKGKFILSYNDDEYIRELYKEFEIEEVERSHNLSQANGNAGRRYKELIIRNF